MNPSVVRGLDHAATSFRGAGTGVGEPAADTESLAAVYRGRLGSQSPREPLRFSSVQDQSEEITDLRHGDATDIPAYVVGSGGGDCINVLALSGGPGHNRGGNDGPRAGIVDVQFVRASESICGTPVPASPGKCLLLPLSDGRGKRVATLRGVAGLLNPRGQLL